MNEWDYTRNDDSASGPPIPCFENHYQWQRAINARQKCPAVFFKNEEDVKRGGITRGFLTKMDREYPLCTQGKIAVLKKMLRHDLFYIFVDHFDLTQTEETNELLAFVATSGSVKNMEVLWNRGFNVNVKINGNSLAYSAVWNDDVDMLDFILYRETGDYLLERLETLNDQISFATFYAFEHKIKPIIEKHRECRTVPLPDVKLAQ